MSYNMPHHFLQFSCWMRSSGPHNKQKFKRFRLYCNRYTKYYFRYDLFSAISSHQVLKSTNSTEGLDLNTGLQWSVPVVNYNDGTMELFGTQPPLKKIVTAHDASVP